MAHPCSEASLAVTRGFRGVRKSILRRGSSARSARNSSASNSSAWHFANQDLELLHVHYSSSVWEKGKAMSGLQWAGGSRPEFPVSRKPAAADICEH